MDRVKKAIETFERQAAEKKAGDPRGIELAVLQRRAEEGRSRIISLEVGLKLKASVSREIAILVRRRRSIGLRPALSAGAVEAARGAIVDVLDAGLLAQLGVLQPLRQPLVTSQRRFTFEQERKPFGVAEACGVAAGFDVGEGLGHAVKAERVELIEGRMRKQDGIYS